jgi:hypothetical protein
MSELPFIDEHSITIAVPAQDAFDAAADTMPRLAAHGPSAFYARLVGCDGGRPFHVATAVRPGLLVLRGRHRFARYELAFAIAPAGQSSSTVRAATSASFPGLAGSAYRAAVIGTGAHRIATNRLLQTIKARAERGVG